MKFKIGDRVKCVREDDWDSDVVLEQVGIVKEVDNRTNVTQPYLVDFEDEGHWYISEGAIELIITIPFNYLS